MPPSAHDTMTLAGLAAANGPWLAVRLHRLAEHAGLSLDQALVENAVVNTSSVLGRILDDEGRPSPSASEATDPAVALGREQAQWHQRAGLAMPSSLKVQRLLRRAYDDLVRESWVEKESRARAHEDVERFFERCLIGLVATWTGQTGAAPAPAPAQTDESQAKLLARREDELRRAMEAAQKLTLALRQSRDQAETLGGELAQARARLKEQEALKARLAETQAQFQDQDDLRARLAQAQAQLLDQSQEQEELLAQLAQAQAQLLDQSQEQEELLAQLAQAQAQLAEHGDLKAQLAEIKEQAGQSLTNLKAQLTQLKEQAGQSLADLKAEFANAHAQSLAQAQAEAQAENQALTSRIRDLETERTALGSRLAELEMALAAHGDAETSRIEAQEEIERARAEADRARQKADRARAELQKLQEDAQDLRLQSERLARGVQAEADGLRGELRQLREDHASLASEAEAMRARLSEAGSRLTETRQAEDEEIRAGLAQAADALAQAQARIAELEAEQADLTERLKHAEAQVIKLVEALKRAKAELAGAGQQAAAQARSLEDERLDMAARLKDAEAQIITLSEEVQRTRAELATAQSSGQQATVQAQGLETERLDMAARLKDAEAQIITLSEEMRRTKAELATAQSSGRQATVQAQNLETERLDLAGRLKAAEAQVIQLTEELAQLKEDKTRAQALHEDAERRAADVLARSEEAQHKAKAELDEISAAREAATRLLSAHLALTPDAVASLDSAGAFSAWNKRFPTLFGLADETLSTGINGALPRMAASILRPEPFLSRIRELLASSSLAEEGMTLTSVRGETLVFRSMATRSANGAAGRVLNFSDVSLEHDMESLVREIEGITRYELGQSLTSFIHLPQELLDDPGTTPAQAQKLAVIRDSGYRIVNTVNMAVDLFRMERGLYRMPQGRTLDLAVVARRAVKDVGPLAASRHVDLELLLDASPLPQDCVLNAPGDPILAHALAVHLLRDGLEGAPRQSGVNAVLHQDQSGLILNITRQGVLAVDEVATYFDKPSSQDPDYGLRRARYAAQLITKSLGGSLALSSTPQTGTILSLRLPR